MTKTKTQKWKLVFNQRTYQDNDRYAEGDNEAFLICPYCGAKNNYNIIKEPTQCVQCGGIVEGIQ